MASIAPAWLRTGNGGGNSADVPGNGRRPVTAKRQRTARAKGGADRDARPANGAALATRRDPSGATTATKSVRIGLVQMRCDPDPDVNLAAAIAHTVTAAGRGAQIVCLPELFRSQYFCQSEDHGHFALAEPVPGATTEALGDVARRLGVAIIASLFERRAAGVYHNTAVVLDADGRMVGKYRKMHIPDDPLYYEKFYFTPGDLGFQAAVTRFAKVGTLVCWDQWYPEAARLTALQGAEILFYPTAIGWHPGEKVEYGEAQHSAWETVQRAHAIANGIFVAVPNRVGHETPLGGDGIEFWGRSFVVSPAGEVVARASDDREEVLVVDCDLARVEQARTHWPFLRDRRIDAYGDITKRYLD
jgi:N-carbamoylputrescine amidase